MDGPKVQPLFVRAPLSRISTVSLSCCCGRPAAAPPGKHLDAQPWRRSLLLSQPLLAPFTAGLAAQQNAGHALFFLADATASPSSSSRTTAAATSAPTPALSVQQLLKQQFRHQAWRKVDRQQVRGTVDMDDRDGADGPR